VVPEVSALPASTSQQQKSTLNCIMNLQSARSRPYRAFPNFNRETEEKEENCQEPFRRDLQVLSSYEEEKDKNSIKCCISGL
jgi:hypothetical protein